MIEAPIVIWQRPDDCNLLLLIERDVLSFSQKKGHLSEEMEGDDRLSAVPLITFGASVSVDSKALSLLANLNRVQSVGVLGVRGSGKS